MFYNIITDTFDNTNEPAAHALLKVVLEPDIQPLVDIAASIQYVVLGDNPTTANVDILGIEEAKLSDTPSTYTPPTAVDSGVYFTPEVEAVVP